MIIKTDSKINLTIFRASRIEEFAAAKCDFLAKLVPLPGITKQNSDKNI